MEKNEIKEYLKEVGIRHIRELDTGLINEFGFPTGHAYITELCRLFDELELRLAANDGRDPHVARQTELVDFFNQNEALSLLASSYYDRSFFRKALGLLCRCSHLPGQEILDIGCGNGIISCFAARLFPESEIIGTDISEPALRNARLLAERLHIENISFRLNTELRKAAFDTVLSFRTFHENAGHLPRSGKAEDDARIRRYTSMSSGYALELAGYIAPGGRLLSLERYEKGAAWEGLLRALENAGLRLESDTQEELTCLCGDDWSTFQFAVFVRL